jgi:hypothetical protein
MISERQLKAFRDEGLEINTLVQVDGMTYLSAQIPSPSQIGMLLCGPGVIFKGRNNIIEVENLVVTQPFVWINFKKGTVPSPESEQPDEEE